MVKIFLFGISGKMGRRIVECANERGVEVVGGFDITAHPTVPTYTDIDSIPLNFDVIVDFSRAEVLPSVIALMKRSGKGAVLASTGYSDSQEKEIRETSSTCAVLRSGNMSVGVNLLLKLVSEVTAKIGDAFDIEIIEKHHNQKADAPSGTALMLANAVKEVKTDAKFLYGREGASKRNADEVTIHAVRGGTIVGEHEVIFAGADEIITLSHTALSRGIFAEGAIKAAKFLADKTSGYYTMKNALE